MANSKVFRPGDVVLDNCQPFVCQIADNERDNRCHYCLKECTSLKRCGQCLRVMYCSRQCQRRDWKDVHKFKECLLLKKTIDCDHQFMRLFVRFVCKVTFDVQSKDKEYPQWDGTAKKFSDLIGNIDESLDAEVLGDVRVICMTVKVHLDRLFRVKLGFHQLIHLFVMSVRNRIAICDPLTFNEIGDSVFLFQSAFKHGMKCQFARALRTVSTAEEQPTISYIEELDLKRRKRRQILFERFGFECQCRRCAEHTDRDFDFNRYQYLIDNPSENDLDYWDEKIEMIRQLFGQHIPDMTFNLMYKFRFLFDTYAKNPLPTRLEESQELTKEVETEFMVTHGTRHPFYPILMKGLKMVNDL